MFTISRDTPCYYLTSVAKKRLLVFRTNKICEGTGAAASEARKSCGFALFAYVIMPNHLHLITDSAKKSSVILRFVNGIVSRRVIDYLKENNYETSLEKLRHEDRGKGYKYSLWGHHPDIKLLWNEEMFMQRVNYTHQNPVRAGLVEHPKDYRWSSWRCWNHCPLPDEPLQMEINQIRWRNKK
jgi:REP element-mobilizing transposase RayT